MCQHGKVIVKISFLPLQAYNKPKTIAVQIIPKKTIEAQLHELQASAILVSSRKKKAIQEKVYSWRQILNVQIHTWNKCIEHTLKGGGLTLFHAL